MKFILQVLKSVLWLFTKKTCVLFSRVLRKKKLLFTSHCMLVAFSHCLYKQLQHLSLQQCPEKLSYSVFQWEIWFSLGLYWQFFICGELYFIFMKVTKAGHGNGLNISTYWSFSDFTVVTDHTAIFSCNSNSWKEMNVVYLRVFQCP